MTRLNFGAINHRATVWVDGQKVGTQVTSYTNSVFDITDYVRPGKTAEIEVLVEGRKALVGPDGRYTVPEGASWSDDVAQGIFRSADLEVFPAVYVSDTVVRTFVTDHTLSYDVYLTNATSRTQKAELSGTPQFLERRRLALPRPLADRQVSVPADTTMKVTIGPVARRAGKASYWWPNLPYRAKYRAQLHDLGVRLDPDAPAKPTSTADVRFGFREFARWATTSSQWSPGQLPRRQHPGSQLRQHRLPRHQRRLRLVPGLPEPSAGNAGWPKAVDNYLRLNYNSVRIHQVPRRRTCSTSPTRWA